MIGVSGRPGLIDLYCRAGGASVGYHRAGFDVIGVDIEHQSAYPYTQITRDVMDFDRPAQPEEVALRYCKITISCV